MGDMEMAKQIKDFLYPKEKWEKEHRDYFLDDVVENDPTKVCPRCSYRDIKILHTHNIDGTDYECRTCKLSYTIFDFGKGEANPH